MISHKAQLAPSKAAPESGWHKKIDVQNKLAWTLQDSEPQRALTLSQEAYEWSNQEQAPYIKGLALGLRNLGAIHYNLGDYQTALSHLFEALALFEAHLNELSEEQTSVLRTIGLTYLRLANHPLSLEFQMRALKLAKANDDPNSSARALNNIAAIHHWSGDYTQALTYYEETLEISQKLKDTELDTILLGNMSDIYRTLGDYENALAYGHRGLQNARMIGNRLFEANIVGTIGQIYLLTADMAPALTHFQTLLDISIETGERLLELGALLHIGKVYTQQGLQDGLPSLHRALKLAEEIDAKSEMFECHQTLAQVYKEQGDFTSALHHYERFHTIEKEVFSNESAQKLKSLQVTYETEAARKEADFYQLKNVTLEEEIVKRKQVESELRHAKDEAERARRYAEVAQDRAEKANRAKDIFLATMSHELRTPLNSILGYTQILRRDMAPSPQQHRLAIIEESGHHLLNLINDVLDFAQIEAGRVLLNHEPTLLRPLLQRIYDSMKLPAEAKGIHFRLEVADGAVPEVIDIDEHRLRQVLINLLENAIKFTDQGMVLFQVGYSIATEDGLKNHRTTPSIRFLVKDTGAGIAQDDKSIIFTLFGQGKKEDTQKPGMGLGLTIAQNLLHLMGSELYVESTLGMGSTFWFDLALPIDQEGPEEWENQTRQKDHEQIIGYHGNCPRILIIDDNAANRAVLVEMLAPIGVEIIEASTGEEGIKNALNRRPDGIIVDLVMAQTDGIEVIRQIRQSSRLSDVVIIATSASVFPKDQQKSLTAGCNAFLPKPIEMGMLFQKLRLLNVDWRYERQVLDVQHGQDETDTDPSSLKQHIPPSGALESLLHSAEMGDIEDVREQIDRLAQASSEFHSFLAPLEQLTNTFQMNKLLHYLQESLKKSVE